MGSAIRNCNRGVVFVWSVRFYFWVFDLFAGGVCELAWGSEEEGFGKEGRKEVWKCGRKEGRKERRKNEDRLRDRSKENPTTCPEVVDSGTRRESFT